MASKTAGRLIGSLETEELPEVSGLISERLSIMGGEPEVFDPSLETTDIAEQKIAELPTDLGLTAPVPTVDLAGIAPPTVPTGEFVPGQLPTVREVTPTKPGASVQPTIQATTGKSLGEIITPTVSGELSGRDKEILDVLVQRTRDNLSRRGISTSPAGARVEGQIIAGFLQELSAQGFQRERQLAQEELQKAGLRITAEGLELQRGQAAFGQQLAAAQFDRQGANQFFEQELASAQNTFQQELIREQQRVTEEQFKLQRGDVGFAQELTRGEFLLNKANVLFSQENINRARELGEQQTLFNMQLASVDQLLKVSGLRFNQDQTIFTTNLTAAGMPVQEALQFMSLAQQGNIAALNGKLAQIGVAEARRGRFISAVSSMFGAAATVGGAFIGSAFGPAGTAAGAQIGSTVNIPGTF